MEHLLHPCLFLKCFIYFNLTLTPPKQLIRILNILLLAQVGDDQTKLQNMRKYEGPWGSGTLKWPLVLKQADLRRVLFLYTARKYMTGIPMSTRSEELLQCQICFYFVCLVFFSDKKSTSNLSTQIVSIIWSLWMIVVFYTWKARISDRFTFGSLLHFNLSCVELFPLRFCFETIPICEQTAHWKVGGGCKKKSNCSLELTGITGMWKLSGSIEAIDWADFSLWPLLSVHDLVEENASLLPPHFFSYLCFCSQTSLLLN